MTRVLAAAHILAVLCAVETSLAEDPPVTTAAWTVGAVSRNAQARLSKEPWTPVATGAPLSAGGGMRTLERSSGEAIASGGGRVILSERTTVTVVAERTVSLVAGQLDAEVPAGGAPLVAESAGTRVSLRGEGGPGLMRVRVEGAVLRVMAYAGAVRVEASSGTPLDVAAGFGLVAGPSAAPEKLLPSPLASAPVPGAAPDHANPRVWWEEVPAASAYAVEICRDPSCAQLEDRAASVGGAPWAPEGLPLAELYWRVSAISATGLDGPPSKAVRFTIRSLWRKPHPRPTLN